MSTTLMMRPIREGISLPDALKFILRDKMGSSGKWILTERELPYLQGLADAGIVGAKSVINAIEKHEVIELFYSI